jgi:hypothetical protein
MYSAVVIGGCGPRNHFTLQREVACFGRPLRTSAYAEGSGETRRSRIESVSPAKAVVAALSIAATFPFNSIVSVP